MTQSLKKTPVIGKIVWLGIVRDSEKDTRSNATNHLNLTFAGQDGECHAGLTRPSCSRVLDQYPRNTVIKNTRQLSIVSIEEIEEISRKLGVKQIDPSTLGASMVVQGIPDFTHIPPSTRIQIGGEGGTTLTIDMENRPCSFTGNVVQKEYPTYKDKFKNAAVGLRGVTAWVEREGSVYVDDTVTVHIPDQRPWNYCVLLTHFDMMKQQQNSNTILAKLSKSLVVLLIMNCIVFAFILFYV